MESAQSYQKVGCLPLTTLYRTMSFTCEECVQKSATLSYLVESGERTRRVTYKDLLCLRCANDYLVAKRCWKGLIGSLNQKIQHSRNVLNIAEKTETTRSTVFRQRARDLDESTSNESNSSFKEVAQSRRLLIPTSPCGSSTEEALRDTEGCKYPIGSPVLQSMFSKEILESEKQGLRTNLVDRLERCGSPTIPHYNGLMDIEDNGPQYWTTLTGEEPIIDFSSDYLTDTPWRYQSREDMSDGSRSTSLSPLIYASSSGSPTNQWSLSEDELSTSQ